MNKNLVAYFSASGVTARVANNLAEAAKADLFEIRPQKPYTKDDLNWNDKNSRSSIEMSDTEARPAIDGSAVNMEQYDHVFLGFPIWWYVAPRIINTFLESYDFAGKKIILFATSGGSGFGKAASELRASCPGAIIEEGRILNGNPSKKELAEFAEKHTR